MDPLESSHSCRDIRDVLLEAHLCDPCAKLGIVQRTFHRDRSHADAGHGDALPWLRLELERRSLLFGSTGDTIEESTDS